VRQSPATAITSADSLVFRVTFDEAVQNVDSTDFTVSGVSGALIGVASQSSTVYDVTVSGGNTASYTGTVSLGFAGGQDIADTPAGNALTNTTPTGANESYTLDNTAPAAPSTPDMTAGTDTGSSTIDNTTSDSTPTFTGTAEANATVTVSSSVSGPLGTTTADGSGNWSFTPGSAMTEGVQNVTATATDAVGNTSSSSAGLGVFIDTTPPLAPSTPDMTAGTDLGASDTDNATSDTTPTFSGTSVQSATITVISSQDGTLGTTTSDVAGNWSFTPGSALSSGAHNIMATAADAAGNVSSASSALAITIDTSAPTVTSIARQTPATATTNADSLVFRVTFSEGAAAVDAADFTVTGTSGTVSGVAQNSTSIYDVTVSGGDMASVSGTIDLGFAGGQNITDTAGNALSNTTPGSEETYTLDNTAPSGYSVTLDQDPVNAGNQTAASFTFAGAEVGATYNYTISSSGGGANVTGSASIASATQQISSIDVSGLGDGTLTLSVTLTDPAGNAGSAATDTTTKEAQAPQVNSITVSGSPAGNATSVDFTVTFSEAAQNISTDDFALTTTGTATGTIASVSSATGTSVTVTVNTISGDGTIRLDLNGATNIQDAVGNSGPNAYTSGSVHTVDNTAPAAFNVAFQAGLITQANQTASDLRFTTAETGTTYAYSISSSGGGAPVTGTGTITTATQDVSVNVSSLPDGTLTLTATLTDSAGNVTNQSAADTVSKATAVPGFSLAFAPASVLTGGTSTATFTIDNSALGVAATSLDFANNLPAGVTVATTPNAGTTCTGGTLSATNGANSLAYTGGTVSAGASCTVSVDVTASTPGAKLNTSGNLTSNLGNSGTAAATLTVTQPALSVDDPSIVEGDAGTANLVFTVTLAPASPQTVTVDYATSNGTATAGDDYTAATGTLTFNPSDTTQTVTVIVASDATVEPDETLTLTLSNPSNATLSDATGTGTITTDDVAVVDNTPPTILSVARQTPTDQLTNEDSLSWTVTFSEAVKLVDAADFTLSGTEAASISVAGSGSAYTVTAIGGPLAKHTGIVGLQLAGGASISDLADNTLGGGIPGGAETYQLDNTGPVATLVPSEEQISGPFMVTISFDEAVTGFEIGDLVVQNASVSGLNSQSQTSFTVDVTPPSSGSFSIALAADAVTDALGNPNLASDVLELEVDQTPPTLLNITANSGLVTNADTLEWGVEFSEAVTGFDAASVAISGAAGATVSVSGADERYTVSVSGGGLATLDGSVILSIPASDAITDGSGLAFEGEGPTGQDQSSIRLDNTAPTLSLSADAAEVVGPFELTISFDEAVTTLSSSALSVTNGAVSDFTRVNASTYTAVIAPEGFGTVAVSIAAGVVSDEAGNANNTASASVEAVAQNQDAEVQVNIDVSTPVGQTIPFQLNNPGVTDVTFISETSTDWLTIRTPTGKITAGSSIEFPITINEAAGGLGAGVHTGEVVVTRITGGSDTLSRAGGGIAPASASGPLADDADVIARIPVTLVLTSDGGSIQLVSTTPSGLSGDVEASFSSDVIEFDGLQLSTVNGYAETAAIDVDSGLVSIRQTLPAGWRVDSISCAGDADNGSQADLATGAIQIDLDPGEDLVCTFTNVRDEDVVRLATQRAIRNFMFRRADRIIDAAPDLSTRLSARDASGAGEYAANMDEGRYTMSLNASLAGARNQAKARDAEAPGMPSHMRDAQDVNRFDVWLSAELAGVTDDRAGERAESDFGVAQLGADWAVSDDLLIGGLVQFDWMDETAREIFEEAGAIAGARVDGEGWMAGPYVVWRMADRVVLDGLAMYGTSSNTVNPLGLYEDEFETDRWMVRANLTGEYGRGALLVRPQATLTHFEETQDGYTDSLGIVIPSQSIALGRLSAGPEFVWRQDRRDGAYWELRSKVRAVWDYQPAELLMESGQFSSADSEFRADGEVGVAATLRNGAQLELSVGLAGIGQSDFEATTARFNLRYPLSLGH
jgi:hypothetical protein